jgi:hypothetical protein
MTNFPATLDTFLNPTSATTMDAAGYEHDLQHDNLNDAVAALQVKVGITGSLDSTSLDYKVNHGGVFIVGGKLALGGSVSSGTVTGLALAFTPSSVVLTVQTPDGQNIFATLTTTPTTDGFQFQLSSATDTTGYNLHYACVK